MTAPSGGGRPGFASQAQGAQRRASRRGPRPVPGAGGRRPSSVTPFRAGGRENGPGPLPSLRGNPVKCRPRSETAGRTRPSRAGRRGARGRAPPQPPWGLAGRGRRSCGGPGAALRGPRHAASPAGAAAASFPAHSRPCWCEVGTDRPVYPPIGGRLYCFAVTRR